MPFATPTLTELIDLAEADVAAAFGLSALLPQSVLSVLARTLAGQAFAAHGHIDWSADQLLPDTASPAVLERWARLFGIIRKPATPATGTVAVTGTEGSILYDGTALRRQDGVEYQVDGTQTIALGSGGALSALVRGANGTSAEDAPAGTVLTFTSTPSGVSSTAAVEAPGLIGAASVETDASLLARLLLRLQTPPQGGSVSDYTAWALEVQGVTRAWCLPAHLGAGSVGVTFAVDDDPDGAIPDSTQVAAVQAYIDDPSRRPVTAAVTVFAPTARPVSFTIALTPDDASVRAAVEANLRELIKREATPGATLLRTHIAEAISVTPGEVDHVLTTPAADIVLTDAQLGTFGSITWS